jgi:nucleoid-associated protein YgaU
MTPQLILLAALIVFAAAPLRADYEFLGIGARPAGMGSAYTAMADDSYGIYYNPGGISFAAYSGVSAEYSRFWMGLTDGSNLSDGSLSYVHPLANSKTSLGMSWRSFSLAGYYTENAMTFAWARKMTQTLGLGVGLKYLTQGYTMDEYTLGSYAGMSPDPVFDGGRKSAKAAVALDPGVLWNFYPDYFAGVSIININQPDIGIAEKELLPMVLNAGIAYRYDYAHLNKFNLAFGATYSDGDMKTQAGIEKWFGKKSWAIRAGTGFGARQYFNVSVGATVAFKSARIDYSASLPLGSFSRTDGTHRISITYEFAPPDSKNIVDKNEEVKTAKREAAEYQQETKQLKNKILELETKLEEARRSLPSDVNYLNDRIRSLDDQLKQAQKNAAATPATVTPAVLPGIIQQPAQPVPAQVQEEQPAVPAQEYVPTKRPAPAPAHAPKPKMGGGAAHTVKPGESLPSIAEKYYGDSSQWKKIYEANKNKIKRGQVEPGQVLVIP